MFPHIDLYGSNEIILNYLEEYREEGFSATRLNRDISDDVKGRGKVNSKKLGTYKITYEVENKWGTTYYDLSKFTYNCDSIEEILKSEYINATCYMVMDGMELVSVYKDFNGKLYLMDMANSRIPYDHETRTILINESILEKLPQNAHMLDVYYLWGQTSYQGSALYYKTDLGDFVYYKYYSVGGKQYLFP